MNTLFVVTAFDKAKNMRASITQPLSKKKATAAAKSLANDMLIAIPKHRNLSKIRIEPITMTATIESMSWEEVGAGATMLSESFVIHLN